MIEHVVGHAAKGQLLFHTWAEGRALFRRLVRAFPGLAALCVMPHHTHVVGEGPDAEDRQVAAEGAFTRWRNRTRGELAVAWARHPPPSRVADQQHLQRTVRYVHLNPVRDGLVGCPLQWPLSSHRDACGLAIQPVLPRARRPRDFHRYVSSDPNASVTGTPFPELDRQDAPLAAVTAAVSAAGRYLSWEIRQRGRARTIALALASLSGTRDAALLAAAFDMSPSAVRRQLGRAPGHVSSPTTPLALRVAATVLNDPRFGPLSGGDLRALPGWPRG